jgi:hypothetical protein
LNGRGVRLTLLPGRPTVYTHGLVDVNRMPGDLDYEAHRSGVPLTCVKTGIIIARHVPCATHLVVDVVAKSRRSRCVVATAEAKLVKSDEILACEKSVGYIK